MPTLHRDDAERASHVLVGQPNHATGRLQPAAAQPLCQRVHGLDGGRLVQWEIPAQHRIRRDSAQNEVGIGDGGLDTPPAIARRPGLSPGGLRTDQQQTPCVHPRNGATTRSNGVDVNGSNHQRPSANTALVGERYFTVHQRHIGRCSSHVEGQQIGTPRDFAEQSSRRQPSGRT